MQAYEISKNEGEPSSYAGDLAAVRAAIRCVPKGEARDWVRVRLVEFPHDKAALLQLLNGVAPPLTTRRSWRISRRGRLIETEPDET
jgi:hypothetical protein